jgi:hypothetical protein
MPEEKKLIRWEKHYSDGSVEFTDEESTKNFVINLDSASALVASREYMSFIPVKWTNRQIEKPNK